MTGNVAGTSAQNSGRILRPTLKALPADARSHNRALILRTLFHGGPISRADLARATGLTRVSVSDLVADLIESGLVEECGQKPQKIGKPGILVRMRADASSIVSLDLAETDHLRGAVLDLNGAILHRSQSSLNGAKGDAAIAIVEKFASELIGQAERPVLGVGIGSPGIVHDSGLVAEAPNLGWFGLPLAEMLTERFGHATYVANDANTAALAEFTFGGASDAGVMVLTVGAGVGAGIVIDGALLRGHAAAAGEIGHVTAIDDGELCGCGRRGCLETVLSAPALRAAVAGASTESAAATLAAVGRTAGTVLAPVVSALNLKEIVLAGPADLLDGTFRHEALSTIRARTMPVIGNDLEMRMAALGEEVTLIGGAVLVLSGELGVT